MSLRLQMLQVARLAPKLLGDSAPLIVEFLRSQMNPDGGFKDRAGNSDLYYTVFGIEGLFILREALPLEGLESHLKSFGDGADLDIVHLACLARCWAMLPSHKLEPQARESILKRLESHRSVDGGYDATPSSAFGTIYGCFLVLSAYQDLNAEIPNARGVAACIESMRAEDGGYSNQRELPMGLTPSTAAAVTLLSQLGAPVDPTLGKWLLERAHPEGGFFATPAAPIPDLLSTATALHALAAMKIEINSALRDATLDFIDTLWSSRGAFYGNWDDDILDCEYTWYGLLALGHLSL
jgi:prenyltransferase beta subunit